MSSRRALLLGDVGDELRALIADILDDLDVRLIVSARREEPDLVLVVLEGRDSGENLPRARRCGVPVVVVVACEDDLLVERVRRMGFASVYKLGRPLAELRACVLCSV